MKIVVFPNRYAWVAELGLFGMTVPENVRGAGFSLWDACRVIAEFGESIDRSGSCSDCMLGSGAEVSSSGGRPNFRPLAPRIALASAITGLVPPRPVRARTSWAIRTTGRAIEGTKISD